MFVKHLLKALYKETEEKALSYLTRAAHDRREHLCVISIEDKDIVASIKELGYCSKHNIAQRSTDIIQDIQDQTGQHLLMRFGLPNKDEKPRKISFIILPFVFSKLGFVSTSKMIKYCKADRRVGDVVVVNFNVIGK